jgi:hypothetical protein
MATLKDKNLLLLSKKLFLNKREIKQLAKLGKGIIESLSCDVDDLGIPCKSDRFAAAGLMVKYLKIHSYRIVKPKKLP